MLPSFTSLVQPTRDILEPEAGRTRTPGRCGLLSIRVDARRTPRRNFYRKDFSSNVAPSRPGTLPLRLFPKVP